MNNYYLMAATADAIHQERLAKATHYRLIKSLRAGHSKWWQVPVSQLRNWFGDMCEMKPILLGIGITQLGTPPSLAADRQDAGAPRQLRNS